jgi:hypothetical protein
MSSRKKVYLQMNERVVADAAATRFHKLTVASSKETRGNIFNKVKGH